MVNPSLYRCAGEIVRRRRFCGIWKWITSKRGERTGSLLKLDEKSQTDYGNKAEQRRD